MSTRAHVLTAIDFYLETTGTASWALGREAAGCDKVIPRIRSGANVGLRTVEALEACMRTHPDGIRSQRAA